MFFNRDELKTRAQAVPPQLRQTQTGVRYLAPSDPVAGGTWMLVNEQQVTVCLLNRWHESSAHKQAYQSRGLLVSGMAGCSSAIDVMHLLQQTDYAHYRPFTLVALDPNNILAAAWNGEILTDEVTAMPLTSSSYRFPEVAAARRITFSNLPEPSLDHLQTYQQGESPASAYTVRMNRPDAQTWSRSQISVSAEHITWEYIEEPADLIGTGTKHMMELPL